MEEEHPHAAMRELETSLMAPMLEEDCMNILSNSRDVAWETYVYLGGDGHIADEATTVAILAQIKADSEFYQRFGFFANEDVTMSQDAVNRLPTLHPARSNAVNRQLLAAWDRVADRMLPLPVFEAHFFRIALGVWRQIIKPMYVAIRDSYLRSELSDAFLALYMHIGQLERGLERCLRACDEANELYEATARTISEARQWRGAREIGGIGRTPGTANSSDVSDLELGEALVGPEDMVSEQRLFIGGDAAEAESAIEDEVESGGEGGSSNVLQSKHPGSGHYSAQQRQGSPGPRSATSPLSDHASPPRRRRSWEATQRHAIYIDNDEQWRKWTNLKLKRVRRPSWEVPQTKHGRKLDKLEEEEEPE